MEAMSTEDEGRKSAALPVVPVRFGRGELNAFVNRGAEPPTPDDLTVLAEAEDRTATEDELRAFAERMWTLHRAEQKAG